HQFDLYRLDHSNFPFYRVEQTFSRAYFTQGTTQEDTYFKGQFSREFDNNINLTLDYSKINNQGDLLYQRATNIAFGLGLWYQSRGKRYQNFFTFISNSNEIEDNGGIEGELIASDGQIAIVNPVLLTVRSQSAKTRYATEEWAFTQSFKPLNATDSLHRQVEGDNVPLLIKHEFRYQNGSYKFYDEDAFSDQELYGNYATDERGIRQFISYRTFQNEVRLASYQVSKDSLGSLQTRNLLEAGLRHQYFNIYQEPETIQRHNLFVVGKLRLSLSDRLSLNGQAHYGLLANRNDYQIKADLLLNFGKVGKFSAGLLNQQYSPSILEEQLFINQKQFWENDFDKTITTTLSAKYEFPFFKLSAEGRYHLLNNYVYFDTSSIVQQTGIPISIPQLILRGQFKVWRFYLDNEVNLQALTEDLIRLPNYYSKHSLYYFGPLFKQAMEARIGFDLRMNSDFLLNAYQPVIGQFYLQNEQTSEWQYLLDVFVNFKVQKFRFTFRFENLLPWLTRDYYYLTAHHPIIQSGLRFGIAWEFVD
ncbi:MAG: hypothetical protein KDC44_16045, partial [Phaeodactylibacter sp.]|nr:hypothetical protein [Phaeodactylibacter sp.]